jgi:hypothetical protein
MRSIELWGALAPLRISRFRVRFAPRNDQAGFVALFLAMTALVTVQDNY